MWGKSQLARDDEKDQLGKNFGEQVDVCFHQLLFSLHFPHHQHHIVMGCIPTCVLLMVNGRLHVVLVIYQATLSIWVSL